MRDHRFIPGYRTREAQRANTSGLAAMACCHFERAEMLFRYGAGLRPDLSALWLNLGNAVGAQGRHREALRHYHHAHELDPLAHQPRVNAAYAHLQMGEYREGWALYEERWRDPVFSARTGIPADPGKRWDGRAREGKTLLVFNEQGAGDVLMMLRYRDLLTQTGMQIIYRVPAGLLRLVRQNTPKGTTVVTNAERVPEHDWHAPFMSLPHLFRTWEAGDIPRASGYLTADANADIATLPRYTVGLATRGNPNHPADQRRSIHSAQTIAPLVFIDGVHWVALEMAEVVTGDSFATTRVPMRDFSETASVIAALDCLVTVDTAHAHLAGALGVPTLLMLARENDWRWGAEGTTTPWYASVTLCRQQHSGEWGPVVEQVRAELSRRAQSGGRKTA